MPSRWASLGILVFWAIAMVGLVSRDILPDLLIGPPPDLRSIARADRDAGPTRWAILVPEDSSGQSFRSVGRAVTESKLNDEGWLRLESKIWFDSGDVLHNTPFAAQEHGRVDIDGSCEIDPSGNLKSINANVRADGSASPLVTISGESRDGKLFIRSKGQLDPLNFTKEIPYAPKTMIQNALGPIDRMPGLAVGQRWESRVVSPLMGKVEVVKAEVVRKSEIYWDKSMVATLEVVYKIPPGITTRTWVRKSDGLVLRQEVPIPIVKLVVERLP